MCVEIVTLVLFIVTILCAFVSYKITMRQPLYYNLFLVEMHTWTRRRIVQVLHLGQEFSPRESWRNLVAQLRERSPRPPNEELLAISDTNVVIQSPSTVIDAPYSSVPQADSMTLWQIGIPPNSSRVPDPARDSQYAAAAAIAVLARGINPTLSTRTDFGAASVSPPEEAVLPETGVESQDSSTIASINVNILPSEAQNDVVFSDRESVHSESVSGTTTEASILTTPSVSFEDSANTELESSEVSIDTAGPSTSHEGEANTSGSSTNTENDEAPLETSESSGTKLEKEEGPNVGEQFGIRLKFLDDTQRETHASFSETVADFKKKNFPEDVAQGKVVRLIFQGQLLRDDTRSLQSYGLNDGCVLHCHVSNTPYARSAPPPEQPHEVRRRRPTEGAALAPESGPGAADLGQEEILLRGSTMLLNNTAAGRPNVFWRAYRWTHNTIIRAFGPPDDRPVTLEEAAEAAARPLRAYLNIGDYFLWIFAGHLLAVWLFAYFFPQFMDRTSIAAIFLISIFFAYMLMNSTVTREPGAPRLRRQRPVNM
ncbi:unnamed protein product [Caenorhabditis auriculariae]|uniref:Ubiquitin-like domain-containing protein n=1 Tax=Caenorhabditis auriculariae TaxID=2777116 RepID=A0A8S1GWP3_9PELO|nr:unnamed protein product [Caenorhabditis auriculariae]